MKLLVALSLIYHISGILFTPPFLPKEQGISSPPTPAALQVVSVPEFGLVPGVIALLTSGGVFVFLKKRKS